MLEKALKDIAYMLQKINENLSAIKEEIKKGRGSSESVEGFSLKGKEKPVIINGQKLGEHEIYCGETKFVYNRDDIQKALEEAIYKIEGFRKYLLLPLMQI